MLPQKEIHGCRGYRRVFGNAFQQLNHVLRILENAAAPQCPVPFERPFPNPLRISYLPGPMPNPRPPPPPTPPTRPVMLCRADEDSADPNRLVVQERAGVHARPDGEMPAGLKQPAGDRRGRYGFVAT